eukprot:Phypoly_transcript_09114.p1 GENE.Phypoly_transcript_09114~~Phypoly_transcript_09114.p1  ORF type:complete len:452 (+),score=70.82 Phypoly_transcript_09114:65-1420(+)
MSLLVQLAILLLIFVYLWKISKKSAPGSPPVVAGSWPILGHAVPLVRDPLTFFRNARKNHGPIYAIDFMWRRLVIVAGRDLYTAYDRAKEDELSFEKFTVALNINRALFGTPSAEFTNRNTGLFKKIMGENFGDSIREEISRRIDELPDEGILDLKAFANRTVCNVTSQLVFNSTLSEDFCNEIIQFEKDTNAVIFLGAFLPPFLVRKLMIPKLDKRRRILIDQLRPYIANARANPDKQSSYLKRVFETEPDSDERAILTALGAFFAAVANTSSATANVLSFMADYPLTLEGLKLEQGNVLENTEVHKWIMECSRVSTGFLNSLRIATNDFELGGYVIKKGDWSLSERVVQFFDNPENIAPDQFLPDRWAQNDNLQYLHNIPNWGGGLHMCPGKFFALAEMKFLLAAAVEKLHISPAEKEEKSKRFHVIAAFHAQTSQWKRRYTKKKQTGK